MLHSHWKDRSSLIFQMLQSGKYYLIFFNQHRNQNYLHKKNGSKSLLHGYWSTIISSLQPLWQYAEVTTPCGFDLHRSGQMTTTKVIMTYRLNQHRGLYIRFTFSCICFLIPDFKFIGKVPDQYIFFFNSVVAHFT